MLNIRTLLPVFLSPILLSLASAQGTGEADPLFEDHSIVELTITAPFTSLLEYRPNDEYLHGYIAYTDAEGQVVSIDTGLRSRGNYRRQKRVCSFPPLRVNLDKSQSKGTLFHKQDKLKLVVHCRDKPAYYEQLVIREYLAYRILNLLTDISYRVRLARITYVDSEGKDKDRIRYAFFIEHKDRMSKRIGHAEVSTPAVQPEQLVGPYSVLTALFQYLIGNTDFSPIAGAKGEDCCHNSTLFGNEGEPIYAVPYDFDISGIVDAPYATPNPRFGLRSVKQRLYRGRCIHNAHLDDSLRVFHERRVAIFALIDAQSELAPKWRNQVRGYVENFYAIIESESRTQRRITSKCI